MIDLTSKQRSYLMSLANDIDPIVQIGKTGVSPEVVQATLEAFNNRELLKVNFLKTCPDEPALAADKIFKRTHSTLVKVIGRKAILYKPFPENPEIVLPKK